MDVCSLDWGAVGSFVGAAATIYAARIALLISEKWRIQKRSELVSEFSKNLYKQKDLYKDHLANYTLQIRMAFIEKSKSDRFDSSILLKTKEIYNSFHNDFVKDFEILYTVLDNNDIKKKIDEINSNKIEIDSIASYLFFNRIKHIGLDNKLNNYHLNIINNIDSKTIKYFLMACILHSSDKSKFDMN